MRPNAVEILRAIRANVEELLLPATTTPHAESAARNALMLLDHTMFRLENEGQFLNADNDDKRQTLGNLAAAVQTEVEDENFLASAAKLSGALDRVPRAGTYVAVADLTTESESLSRLMDEWLDLLWSNQQMLGPLHASLRQPLREQFRRQLDRDSQLVGSIQIDQVFENKDA
jgi:hypothetical protein